MSRCLSNTDICWLPGASPDPASLARRSGRPQLDAHGAWAPIEEEISIYDLALEADPPTRLWTDRVRTALSRPRIDIAIDLGAGDGTGHAWGCDLSPEYVHINADYTT